MSQSRTTKRLAPDALGMKALITTTSLAVTLGGWAVLAQPKTPTSEAPVADTVAIQVPASAIKLSMAALPTIVQPPAPPPKIIVLSPPRAAAIQNVGRRPAIQVAPQPTAESSSAAAPPPPAVSLPPLRVVSAPPKPVARTRSSR